MDERQKLDEAAHFLKEMQKSTEERAIFEFNLSAFLSAGRSVLLHALEELDPEHRTRHHSKRLPPSRQWFDEQMKDPVFKFLRNRRDKSIHERSVRPKATIAGDFRHHLNIQQDVADSYKMGAGKTPDQIAMPSDSAESTTSTEYVFNGWSGSEGVIPLAVSYLSKLEEFVIEARKQGYLKQETKPKK